MNILDFTLFQWFVLFMFSIIIAILIEIYRKIDYMFDFLIDHIRENIYAIQNQNNTLLLRTYKMIDKKKRRKIKHERD